MSKPHTSGFNVAFSQVMGWSTVVFGINSASNAVRKCEMVRGEAKYYFTLPDCIVSESQIPQYGPILLQINPTSMSLFFLCCFYSRT